MLQRRLLTALATTTGRGLVTRNPLKINLLTKGKRKMKNTNTTAATANTANTAKKTGLQALKAAVTAPNGQLLEYKLYNAKELKDARENLFATIQKLYAYNLDENGGIFKARISNELLQSFETDIHEFTRDNYNNIVVDMLTRKRCLARALFVSLTARRKKIDNNGVNEWSNYSSMLNVRAHNLLKEYIFNLLEAQAKQPAQE